MLLHVSVPLRCLLSRLKAKREGGVAARGQPAGRPVNGYTVLRNMRQVDKGNLNHTEPAVEQAYC